MVWCGIHLRVMPEFVSYQVIWEYVNTCTYVVPVFWSHDFIQMRFGLFSFSCFYFMSNRYYPNFWMLLNLRYQKTSFLCKHNFLLMRTRAMKLDTKAKVFHESISCFMKCPWNCISWNALKEIFHSVSLPFHFIYSKIKSHFWVYFKLTTKYFLVERSGVPLYIYIFTLKKRKVTFSCVNASTWSKEMLLPLENIKVEYIYSSWNIIKEMEKYFLYF